MSDVTGTLIMQRDEALSALRRVTTQLEGSEQAYHMWPSFDRPVKGCRNCLAVRVSKKVLRRYGKKQF